MKPITGLHLEFASGLEVEVSIGALIQPIDGSTTSPIGLGSIENVIDGDPNPGQFLLLGPVRVGTFAGPYSVTFNLGNSFDLTGMVLWNNGGTNEFDGEGVNEFTLTLRDGSSNTLGVFSDDATDTLAQQSFDFAVSNVTFIDFLISSNHPSPERKYVAFYEIAFATVPIPPSVWLLGTLGLIGLVGVGIKKRYESG